MTTLTRPTNDCRLLSSWRKPRLAVNLAASFAVLVSCGTGPRGGAVSDPRHDVTAPIPAGTAPPVEAVAVDEARFRAQWYDRGAEILRLDVVQHRYGQARRSRAVWIFVTEPFRPDALVKDESGGGAVDVLKLNRIERFVTGVYDYSLMTSAFVPLAGGRTLKTTTSVQDWCGQTWLQWKRSESALEGVGHSYFEAENERRVEASADVFLEDGMFCLLRIDPQRLPRGDFAVVPSGFHLSLRHAPLAAATATGTLHDLGDGALRYEFVHGTPERRLSIVFGASFPYPIESFRETIDGEIVAEGRVVATEKMPYWERNDRASEALRDRLALPR